MFWVGKGQGATGARKAVQSRYANIRPHRPTGQEEPQSPIRPHPQYDVVAAGLRLARGVQQTPRRRIVATAPDGRGYPSCRSGRKLANRRRSARRDRIISRSGRTRRATVASALLIEAIGVRVCSAHAMPRPGSARPPQIWTTARPAEYTPIEAPISRPVRRLSARTSATVSNPGSQCP
jgi:hypothetical protein